MKNSEDKSEKFWDRIAKRYSGQAISDDASYQKKLQITRDYLKPEMEVLELGCGTGSTAIIHAPYVKHIRAIDISSNMIEIARSKAEKKKIENITFEKSAVDSLTIQEQKLDVVFCLSVLHLLENKEEVIANIYKNLKSGGIFVSSTICLGDTMRWLKIIIPIGRFVGLMPLVRFFTKNELTNSLMDVGFDIDHFWHPGKGKAVFIIAKKPE
ncbi:MAG: class I SAM-dependent methyltransferase [Candidatus Scalindua sp.]